MIDVLRDTLSLVLIVSGSGLIVTGAIGLVRMPDLYTRMHAGSVGDSLGAYLLISGMILQAGFSLIALKLLFIAALLFFFGPVATHALAQAALHAGVKPLLKEDRRTRERTTIAAADGDHRATS